MDSHLVLYFDINKTVIMLDPIQGKNISCVINDILCDNAFGRIDGNNRWILQHNEILSSNIKMQGDLISFTDYLDLMYPTRGANGNPANKKKRKEFRSHFTDPGFPGEGLKHEYTQLIEYLRLPSNVIGSDQAHNAGLQTEHYFILPAFLELIAHLHKSKRSFNIVFRTFGQDIAEVAHEFNCFCEGNHPFYVDKATVKMDGSTGGVDRRIHLEEMDGFGSYFRNEEKTILTMGTLEQPFLEHDSFLSNKNAEALKKYKTLSGIDEIHYYLEGLMQKRSTLAIRDFYPWWWENNECSSAGKLITVNLTNPDVHVIFFDDKIYSYDPHIADVREAGTGKAVDFSHTKDIHLMRVESFHAIRNCNYFIKLLEKSELNRQSFLKQ